MANYPYDQLGTPLDTPNLEKANGNWAKIAADIASVSSASQIRDNNIIADYTAKFLAQRAEYTGRLDLQATRIENIVNEISNEAFEQVVSSAIVNRKFNPVANFAALATTYPAPENGDAVQTLDDNKTYRYDGTQWVFIEQFGSGPFTQVFSRLDQQKYFFNALEFGTNANGIFNNASAMGSFPLNQTVFLPSGTYFVSSNCTIESNLVFSPGAIIKVATGATVTIKGKILSSSREIFEDNGGSVNLMLSENEHNLGWYKSGTNTINARWSFARKTMTTFARKTMRIPKPYPNQPGTEFVGNRSYWLFDGEMRFEDEHNSMNIYLDAEFKASAATTNFLNFEDTSKPENIYFYGDFQAIVPPALNVGCAINVKGTARITFWGNVVLNGFRTPVKLGGSSQVAPVTDVRFFQLQCSFFYETAVSICGKSGMTTQSVQIDRLTATAAQSTGLNALEIKGSLRNIKIGDVTYATDVAKDGYTANDIENVVLVESNAEGSVIKVEIDSIYQANANNALKIATNSTTPQSVDKIQYIKVRNIFAKFNGNAINIADCVGAEIESIYNLSDATIGSTANYVTIKAFRGVRNITDNGNYTIINNIGKQTRGGGVPPAPSIDWGVGTVIRETSDGKVYIRIAKAGLASDFIALN